MVPKVVFFFFVNQHKYYSNKIKVKIFSLNILLLYIFTAFNIFARFKLALVVVVGYSGVVAGVRVILSLVVVVVMKYWLWW